MKIKPYPFMRSPKAFTIAELLIATVIVLLTSVAILFSYVECIQLNEINKNTVTALENVRSMMETVKGSSFDQVYETYHDKTFPLQGLDGIGLIEIDNKNPLLLGVSIKCFWKQSKDRLMGEDKNFNGILDLDEDTNNNGHLDSPIRLFTYIAKR